MQVDWVSGIIAAPTALSLGYDTGRQITTDLNGEVTSERRMPLHVVDEEPSHSRRFTVMALSGNSLYLSGNPVKLLQAHNLFGSCDALGLFMTAGCWLREEVGMFPGVSTWRACEFVGPRFTRIDLTRSYRFPTGEDARAWIREVAGSSRSRHGAPKLHGSSSAIWGHSASGKGSRRWMMTVYDKQQELIAHARPGRDHAMPSELFDWARGVVRFELRLRSPELQKESSLVDRLKGSGVGARLAALELWSKYFERITFNENAAMTSPTLFDATLPSHLAIKLAAWRGGADLRAMLSTPTFYRVRRELLQHAGVDIASPAPAIAAATHLAGAQLDPAGWDPEPLEAHFVEPGEGVSREYGLL